MHEYSEMLQQAVHNMEEATNEFLALQCEKTGEASSDFIAMHIAWRRLWLILGGINLYMGEK